MLKANICGAINIQTAFVLSLRMFAKSAAYANHC
jgi:hypothetical protein